MRAGMDQIEEAPVMGMAGMQDVFGREQIAAFVAGAELQARYHRGRQAHVVQIHVASGHRVQQADGLRGAARRHQWRMRGSEFEDFAVWTTVDFHVFAVLDTALMDHASEHGRSDRATTEAGGHDADFGLRVFIVPLFGLVDEFEVHLFHPWAIAIAQSAVGNAGQGIVLGAYARDVVATYVAKTSLFSSMHLIVQDSDIGDVFWILVLVVTCAIEASHEQTSVGILLTDQ